MIYKYFIILLFPIFYLSCSDDPTSSDDPKSSNDGKTGITVSDIDGNVYDVVKIGTQWWMNENLKVKHYRNGDIIPKESDYSSWENLISGVYCVYDNNSSNTETYGLLYNWYAGNDDRINKGIPAFEEALKKASIDYKLYMYEGANHAFHNDTNPERYNKEAAQLAWKRTIEFLNEKLKM